MSRRVGVVTYLKARGLGYDAVSLRAAFRDLGFEASFFPVDDLYRVDRRMRKGRVRPAPVTGDWAWKEAERKLDLARWIETRDVVVTLEVFLREVAAIAFAKGVRLVHVPNLEWVSDRKGWNTDLLAADVVVAKTRHTARALRGAGLENLTELPWSIPLPLEDPRPTTTPVTFFHSAGIGGTHDPKNPEAVLHAFRDALAGDERARLVLKTQVPGRRRKAPLDLDPWREIGNIEILEGEIPYDGLLDLVRSADVTVYPSRAEGFGLPLLESLTLGVPVVTTDGPPMNELVRDGENGRLVGATATGRHRHVPLLEVDRAALARTMTELTDLDAVDRLKAGTATGLRERATAFREGLREAL